MSDTKDFYFSQKLKNSIKKQTRDKFVSKYFRGIEFTECVDFDEKPKQYDDNVLIGTGFLEEVQYNKNKNNGKTNKRTIRKISK